MFFAGPIAIHSFVGPVAVHSFVKVFPIFTLLPEREDS